MSASQDDQAAATRRHFLHVVGGVSAGCLLLPACGGTQMEASPDMGPVDLTPPSDQTFAVPEADGLQVNQSVLVQTVLFNMSRTIIARDAMGFMAIWSYCQHAGCPVNINSAALSYDCPCHGSRYNFDGTVLQGPTTSALLHLKLTRENNVLIVTANGYLKGTDARTQ